MHFLKSVAEVAVLALVSGQTVTATLANFDPYAPSGDGCVDPKGFAACFQENVAEFVDCGQNFCGNPRLRGSQSETECLSSVCKPGQAQHNMVCWIKSCWNRGYSCEYQLSAMEYLRKTRTRTTVNGGLPFYPPPDNAPAACSCNLAYVEGNSTVADNEVSTCFGFLAEPEKGLECSCCSAAINLSGLKTCPTTDLSIFELGESTVTTFVNGFGSPDRCAILDKPNAGALCASQYNVSLAGVQAVNPYKLPPFGKQEPTNGAGEFPEDLSGKVYTVSLEEVNFTSVVTLASRTAGSGGSQATPTGTGTRAGTTATGTGAAGSTSTATGAGGKMDARKGFLWSGFAMLCWVLY